jgi:hypothetical protein
MRRIDFVQALPEPRQVTLYTRGPLQQRQHTSSYSPSLRTFLGGFKRRTICRQIGEIDSGQVEMVFPSEHVGSSERPANCAKTKPETKSRNPAQHVRPAGLSDGSTIPHDECLYAQYRRFLGNTDCYMNLDHRLICTPQMSSQFSRVHQVAVNALRIRILE